jgi:adenosylmethionine-8-amino-7-oxononanoate aminotransferase
VRLALIQRYLALLEELLAGIGTMAVVTGVRQRGFMVAIDLGDHDAELRMGHRVTNEARERGAIIRPLGNTVVIVPPLSISADELRELMAICADSIRAAVATAPDATPAN